MVKRLEGKVALVTGAGSGIGRATAVLFAKEGAKCVIVDLSVEDGEKTVRIIKESKGEAFFIKADVSKTAEVEAMVSQTTKRYGRLDCAHNNAGIVEDFGFTADLTEDSWDKTLSVDLKGVWLCMKYEILQMLKQGGGSIVNTTSVAGLRPVPGECHYNAAKAGVILLTATAALEYGKSGIRINAVAPGDVLTPGKERYSVPFMQKLGDSELIKALGQKMQTLPVGRQAMPEEIAEAVVWLCSDAASYVTGSHIIIDGGYMVT